MAQSVLPPCLGGKRKVKRVSFLLSLVVLMVFKETKLRETRVYPKSRMGGQAWLWQDSIPRDLKVRVLRVLELEND